MVTYEDATHTEKLGMQLFNSLNVLHVLPIPYEDHGQEDRYR